MKRLILAAALTTSLVLPASAEAEKYMFDASHSQIVFSYKHFGYSTTWGMFSGFNGSAMLDKDDPSKSSVTVSLNASDMFTGWDARTKHFMSPDFFGQSDGAVSFKSTSVNVTGDNMADVTGDLTINGVTKPVVLKTTLNKQDPHPMKKTDWAGFDATTTIKRSDFNLGKFAPAVSDEVNLMISVEMQKAS